MSYNIYIRKTGWILTKINRIFGSDLIDPLTKKRTPSGVLIKYFDWFGLGLFLVKFGTQFCYSVTAINNIVIIFFPNISHTLIVFPIFKGLCTVQH